MATVERSIEGGFSSFIAGFQPAQPRLPLVHVTDGLHFREILRGKALSPSPCTVFNEAVLYAYYGRPSYRLPGDTASQKNYLAPVAIVLDSTVLAQSSRIYPFDTGAWPLYEAHMHRNMRMNDFLVSPLPESPQRVVTGFYSGNRAYYLHHPRRDVIHDVLELEVEAYISLITSTAASPEDDRRSAIEVQFLAPIEFTSGRALAVVIPEQWTSDERIMSTLSAIPGLKVLSYLFGRAERKQWFGALQQVVGNYLKEQHCI